MELSQWILLTIVVLWLAVGIYLLLVKEVKNPSAGIEVMNRHGYIGILLLGLLVTFALWKYMGYVTPPPILESTWMSPLNRTGDSTWNLKTTDRVLDAADKAKILNKIKTKDATVTAFKVETVEYRLVRSYWPVKGLNRFWIIEQVISGKDQTDKEHTVPIAAAFSGPSLDAWLRKFDTSIGSAAPPPASTSFDAPLGNEEDILGTLR